MVFCVSYIVHNSNCGLVTKKVKIIQLFSDSSEELVQAKDMHLFAKLLVTVK